MSTTAVESFDNICTYGGYNDFIRTVKNAGLRARKPAVNMLISDKNRGAREQFGKQPMYRGLSSSERKLPGPTSTNSTCLVLMKSSISVVRIAKDSVGTTPLGMWYMEAVMLYIWSWGVSLNWEWALSCTLKVTWQGVFFGTFSKISSFLGPDVLVVVRSSCNRTTPSTWAK